MDSIGVDLHKVYSQICILTEAGEIIERRIQTGRNQFAKVFETRPRARILLEAANESEWVARWLEELGHEVIVADPNFAPMYATRTRHVKTDRRDAFALAQACQLGAYRPAHRLSEAQRRVRARLGVRDALVRTRVRYVSLIRGLLRREGLRAQSCSTSSFAARLQEMNLTGPLKREIAPLLSLLKAVDTQIDRCDRGIEKIAERDRVVRRLCTVPGIGPLTASAFVASIDVADRFANAHQLASYLGLVPREQSSGEKLRRGSITKAGNHRVRRLLVEAGWGILYLNRPATTELRTWGRSIASRRGRRVAVVALARKLAGVMYAMWRDKANYQPSRTARAPLEATVTA